MAARQKEAPGVPTLAARHAAAAASVSSELASPGARARQARSCSPSSRADAAANTNSSASCLRNGRRAGRIRPAVAGASRITWALIPPKPKLETPANMPILSGRTSGDSAGRMRPSTSSKTGWGRSQPTCGAMTPARSASTVLITPAKPAAALAWPILALIDPIGRALRPEWAAASARTSVGSPVAVPVPWASTNARSAGSTPLRSCARRIARTCPSIVGRVSPPAPSLDRPQPRRKAKGLTSVRRKSASRTSTAKPAPSAGQKPSERASNTLISSDAKAPTRENPTSSNGSRLRSTAPTTTASARPEDSTSAASTMATSDDAQAASTVKAPPLKSK